MEWMMDSKSVFIRREEQLHIAHGISLAMLSGNKDGGAGT